MQLLMKNTALQELNRFDEIWGGKHPKIADKWRDKWVHLSIYFKYPQAVRTLIYTTYTSNPIAPNLLRISSSNSCDFANISES